MLSCREMRREIHHEISHCRCLGFRNHDIILVQREDGYPSHIFGAINEKSWEVLGFWCPIVPEPVCEAVRTFQTTRNPSNDRTEVQGIRQRDGFGNSLEKFIICSSCLHHISGSLFTFSQSRFYKMFMTFHDVHRFMLFMLVHFILRLQAPSGSWLTVHTVLFSVTYWGCFCCPCPLSIYSVHPLDSESIVRWFGATMKIRWWRFFFRRICALRLQLNEGQNIDSRW